MKTSLTIGEYLIQQLYAHGVRHVFGIPGDYVLGFYDQLFRSKLKVINTCDEQGAGFAADAYARVRGLGAVCVTYCVGGLKLANTTAEAFAEKSPVVVISGAPGMKEREKNPLLHHKVREFDTQKKVFEQLTVASTVLSDPQTAFQEIDRVLRAALRYKRPVYIELPRDQVNAHGVAHHRPVVAKAKSDPEVLRAALAEATAMINSAKQPVILADVEIHRFGLQAELVKLVEKANLPVAATILGKTVMGEHHRNYIGVYEGAMCREEVRRYVESSDCVVMLGAFMTDMNLGIFTARLEPARTISATSEKLSIRHHQYEGAQFPDFLAGLLRARLRRRTTQKFPRPPRAGNFRAVAGRKLTTMRVFERLNCFLDDSTGVVCDVGDVMFGSADLHLSGRTGFLGPAYYTSMGFAVPASIGLQLGNPKLRPLVLVGDGAFQMTGMELSTSVRYGLNPIVVVFNNRGYGTERPMSDGEYNDVATWHFHRLPEVFGAGRSFLVSAEDELDDALESAAKHPKEMVLIEASLDPWDHTPALRRLTARLREKVKAAQR